MAVYFDLLLIGRVFDPFPMQSIQQLPGYFKGMRCTCVCVYCFKSSIHRTIDGRKRAHLQQNEKREAAANSIETRKRYSDGHGIHFQLAMKTEPDD